MKIINYNIKRRYVFLILLVVLLGCDYCKSQQSNRPTYYETIDSTIVHLIFWGIYSIIVTYILTKDIKEYENDS
jgi:phosphate starvation-inducible membrane PsiE